MEVIDFYEDLEFVFETDSRHYLIINQDGDEILCTNDRSKAEDAWNCICDSDGALDDIEDL